MSLNFLIFLLILVVCSSINLDMSKYKMCDGVICDLNCNNCYPCDPSTCLPSEDCHCGSKSIPKGLPLSETPQFVFWTIDDAVVENGLYSILPKVEVYRNNANIRDSNNCPLRPTIYTLSRDSDYSLIAYFEKIGTVSLHTVTHTTDLTSSKQKWKNELTTCYSDLKELTGVRNIYGSRSPYLESNDDYIDTLKELGILYDTSSSYYPLTWNAGSPTSEQRNFWPFTLDYGFPEVGIAYSAGLLNRPHPGVWEVPMTGYTKYGNVNVYEIMDYDVTSNPTQALTDFKNSILANYNSNRAPIGFYFHSYYFLDSTYTKEDPAKISFYTGLLTWLTQLPNVLFATEDRVIRWLKNPNIRTFQDTKNLPDFLCPSFPTWDQACNDGKSRKICTKPDGFNAGSTYTICGSVCPDSKPDINKVWGYTGGSPRTYTNSPANFDQPYNNQITNKNYPRLPVKSGQIVLGAPSTTTYNLNTVVCVNDLLLQNVDLGVQNYGINGFIATVTWCKSSALLQSYESPHGAVYPFESGKIAGFRIVSTKQFALMRYEAYELGSFCLKVNYSGKRIFSWSKVKAAVDLYRVPLFCDMTSTDVTKSCVYFSKTTTTC